MSTHSNEVYIKPTYWLVRVKDCREFRRPENDNEVEDPQNGMILGDNDDIDQDEDDDLITDYRVNSVRTNKAKKKSLSLQCPGREMFLETNAFVWPYPVWLTVRIEVYANVIAPPNHVIADCLQKGRFSVVEYFISDWLASPEAISVDQRGGIGNVQGVSLISQFLSFLRPKMKGHSEVDLYEVQGYDKYKTVFCDYLETRPANDVRLNSIDSLLSDYAEDSKSLENESAVKRQVYIALHQQIISTDEGSLLQMSTEAPDFFRLGPLLFPNKICSLMIHPSEDSSSDVSSKIQLFKVLDGIIVSEPWKLGFSTLIYKLIQQKCTGKKWSGIEAHLRYIKKATFYSELKKEQKDALHVYDTIKVIFFVLF